jgi:hypothetical protein
MTATVIFIGGDKGGTGKTITSRVTLDLITSRGMHARAFDAQWPGGNLNRFNVDAFRVDIQKLDDQMHIFDNLQDGSFTVIDLPAGMLSPTIESLDDARLLEDVRAGEVKMVLLHVLGPTITSIGEIAAAAAKIAGVKHLLVKNHISKDSQYFDWDTGDSEVRSILTAMVPMMIDLPNLDARAVEVIEKRGGSFLNYIDDKEQSRILRGNVRTWLETCWKEFDRVGVLS